MYILSLYIVCKMYIDMGQAIKIPGYFLETFSMNSHTGNCDYFKVIEIYSGGGIGGLRGADLHNNWNLQGYIGSYSESANS